MLKKFSLGDGFCKLFGFWRDCEDVIDWEGVVFFVIFVLVVFGNFGILECVFLFFIRLGVCFWFILEDGEGFLSWKILLIV